MLETPKKDSKQTAKRHEHAFKPTSMPAKSQLKSNVLSGLSGRLLILTVLFVMIAEVLIFVPSIANFRNVWLQTYLDTAEAASIVYLDDSKTMLSPKAQADLLKVTQSLQVSIKEGPVSRLMAAAVSDKSVGEMIKLGSMQPFTDLRSALSTLFFGGERVYYVAGLMKSRNGQIELVQEDRHLRSAMLIYARNILLISLVISLITAGLVFLALYGMIVRPIIRLSSNMDTFSRHPEDSTLIYCPTNRQDEIGIAEKRLSTLQSDLQATLRQKRRLAELGLAVSKINHDLRNILASASLFSDRLTGVADPTVQRLAPKLVKTIDRAVEYTRSVLTYGKAVERPPNLESHNLRNIVEDVGETLLAENADHVEWQNSVAAQITLRCDYEHLFRAILNLCRNSVQAMSAEMIGETAAQIDEQNKRCDNRLSITAEQSDEVLTIAIKDTGPGVPENIRENLFMAFSGSAKPGGTGLGLAISAELIRAHGGSIKLENTGPCGSIFLIELPVLQE